MLLTFHTEVDASDTDMPWVVYSESVSGVAGLTVPPLTHTFGSTIR